MELSKKEYEAVGTKETGGYLCCSTCKNKVPSQIEKSKVCVKCQKVLEIIGKHNEEIIGEKVFETVEEHIAKNPSCSNQEEPTSVTWSAWSKCPICDKKFTCQGYSTEKGAKSQALKLANEHIKVTHSDYWEKWQNKQSNLFKGLRKVGYSSKDFSNPQIEMANNIPLGIASVSGTQSYSAKQEIWQCPTCKLKIPRFVVPGVDVEKFSHWGRKKHQCLKCSKCGKYSSYKNLQLHSIYECSSQQNQPNQQTVNQQIQQVSQLVNLIQQLSQSASTLIQSINNNQQLTPQQKQQIINNLNSNINNLKTIANDLTDKQKKLNDLANKSEQNKPTNWTPWIIGVCVVVGIAVIWLITYFWVKKRER